MSNEKQRESIVSLLRSMHDGVAMNLAERIMDGGADPWMLWVAGEHDSGDMQPGLVVTGFTNPAIRAALLKASDQEGVMIVKDMVLSNPASEAFFVAEVGTGQRYAVYARIDASAVASGGQEVLRIDVHGGEFDLSTEHCITTHDGYRSVALSSFPLDCSLGQDWRFVIPADGGQPSFTNQKH